MAARRNPSSITSFGSAQTVHQSICRSCSHTIRRRYASTAAAVAEQPTSEAPAPQEAHQLLAGVILSRPPQITRDLHPFEKAFFLYQKRLNERLALPFTRYLYYKKKTPNLLDFRKKLDQRKTPARDIGNYSAYSEHAWHDEPMVGAVEGEIEDVKEKLLTDEQPFPEDEDLDQVVAMEEKVIPDAPMPRTTEADKAGDEKSLNRLLQRTLYLLVKDGKGNWRFPSAPWDGVKKETLRESAERIIRQSAGINMHTWIVSNHPVGHFERPYGQNYITTNEAGATVKGEVTFFMKGRIMMGQADIKESELGVSDFKWLPKESIKEHVHPKYWASVDDILPSR
ncbi:hypothetical protein BT63DRAFT_436197 [Microthyrium microscopicum]|uniref:Large ribosomal subunit protein mL46 n=1 Tax=Microthyrium microscopicum TaxID=703497 RepID=A0A6A6UW10_9PEZI|nr:hypothetical protein BT63DRAFT_436197 [Microthyrium microscopicum]